MPQRFDVIVIGSGPAGGAAAATLARGGLAVAMADAGPYGGTCPLRGCEPKKVLWQAAEVVARAQQNTGHGLTGQPAMDWPALMAFKRSFTEPVPAQAEQAYAGLGIATLHGPARFVAPDRVVVGEAECAASHFVVATGAAPIPLGFEGQENVMPSDGFLELDTLPAEVTFVGGGYISFEFAHIAARAGARARIVQRGGRALKGFDPDLAAMAVDAARAAGIEVRLDCPVTAVRREAGRLAVLVRGGKERLCGCDAVVHGAGRAPALEGLGLEAAGVALGRRGVAVDDHLRSPSNPRVYAAGDCADVPFALTPTADMEGRAAARNILAERAGQPPAHAPDYRGVPRICFTLPPLAAAGMDAAEGRAQGHHVWEGDMADWASSRRVGLTHAAYRLVVHKDTGALLGAHLLGHHAEEVINVLGLAIRLGLPARDLKAFPWGYPSQVYEIRHMIR